MLVIQNLKNELGSLVKSNRKLGPLSKLIQFLAKRIFEYEKLSALSGYDGEDINLKVIRDLYCDWLEHLYTKDSSKQKFLDLFVTKLLIGDGLQRLSKVDINIVNLDNPFVTNLNCSRNEKEHLEAFMFDCFLRIYLAALSVIKEYVSSDIYRLKNSIERFNRSIEGLDFHFNGRNFYNIESERLMAYYGVLNIFKSSNPMTLSRANSVSMKLIYNESVPKYYQKYHSEITADFFNFLLDCKSYTPKSIKRRHSLSK